MKEQKYMNSKIEELYKKYKDKKSGSLSSDDQKYIKDTLDSIKTVENKDEAKLFLELLRLLRMASVESIDQLGRKAMDTLVNAFIGGSGGIYANNPDGMNTRFIFELVQNVDDCKYKRIDDCKLTFQFDLKHDILKLEYNELGFKPKNVIAITGLGDSTKNHRKVTDVDKEKELDQSDLFEIGEKGIGFKSVFGLAKSVNIKSGYFNFTINRKNVFLLEVGDYSNFDYSDNTVLELKLDKGMSEELYYFLRNKYKSVKSIINENPILFLNKLTEIQYYASEDDYFGFRVTRDKETEEFSDSKIQIEYFGNDSKDIIISATKFTHEIEYSINECRSRYGDEENSPRKHKIIVIAPDNPSLIDEGRLYSFFATNHKIRAPFIIHAPFKLNSGRTLVDNQSQSVKSKNLWFNRTMAEMMSMIYYAYIRLSRIHGKNIYHYIPTSSLFDYNSVLFMNGFRKIDMLLLKIFKTVEGDYLPYNEVCMLDYNGDIKDITKVHRLIGEHTKLLDAPYGDLEQFRELGIRIVKDVKDLLYKKAINFRDLTEECCKYIKNSKPTESFDEMFKFDIELTYEQALIFSKYKIISSWLNQHVIEKMRAKSNGRSFTVQYKGTKLATTEVKDFCEDYGSSIKAPFKYYVSRVDFVKDEEIKNVLYFDNVVIGNNMLEDFASLYATIDPNDKFFLPFLRMESISEDINNLCNIESENISVEFLNILKNYRLSQSKMLGNQYSKILELIDKSGTNADRFFSELLQNIDDCEYNDVYEPYADFEYEKRGANCYLTVRYNEVGFTRAQIRAITAIGDSTKKTLLSTNSTGEKGIGFKSIFSIFGDVVISTRNVKFTLNSSKPTVPDKIEEIERTEGFSGTEMRFRIKAGMSDDIVNRLLDEKFILKNIFCLRQVMDLNILGKQVLIERLDDGDKKISIGDKTYNFFGYTHTFEIKDTAALIQRNEAKKVEAKQQIEYFVPYKNCFTDYGIYNVLPTSEEINIPMFINMPLELDTARERMLNNEWNKSIITNMIFGLPYCYDELKYCTNKLLPDFLPVNKVTGSVYENISPLMNKLANMKLFKLEYGDEFQSLVLGRFTYNVEYYIINKYPDLIEKKLFDIILLNDEWFYSEIEKRFRSFIRYRKFDEVIDTIESLMTSSKKSKEALSDDKFREYLYDFLSNASNDCELKERIKKLQIIPVKDRKTTKYVSYSTEIFAPGVGDLQSTEYKILDTNIMDTSVFNDIYGHINGYYKPIYNFSRDVVIGSFVERLNKLISIVDLETRAEKVLELFNSERSLFTEAHRQQRDFPVNSIPLVTRNGYAHFKDKCFIYNDDSSKGKLDEVIVDKKYSQLAELIGTRRLKELNNVNDLPFVVTFEVLKDLKKYCDIYGKEIFDSIYASGELHKSLSDGKGYFELYKLCTDSVRLAKNQTVKVIHIDNNLIKAYSKEINKISLSQVPITFDLTAELDDLGFSAVVSEIESELQVRKETNVIRSILHLLSNIKYAELNTYEPCALKSKDKTCLILNNKLVLEYEILDKLKNYFAANFSTEILINRDITTYTRDNYENITTIDSNEDDVNKAARSIGNVNDMQIDAIKDFMCRPLMVNKKVFGGYAKTCPLCGAKVKTELTGMRIFKTKCNDMIIPLISCCNCNDNLRYAKSVDIDTEKLEQGILDMDCVINGENWSVKNVKLRLGHRAMIAKYNKN